MTNVKKATKQIMLWLLAHPAEVFLILAAIFGTIFCFRMAPLSGTDEFTHFPRAYQISDGQLSEENLTNNEFGGYLPSNINNMVSDYRDLSRKGTITEFKQNEFILNQKYKNTRYLGDIKQRAAFSSDSVYPPWSYLPAVAGIRIARALRLPLLWYVYLGRLATLAVWILLVWWALKLLPEGRWFIVVLALLPTTLSQAATIGIDGLIIGVSWLLIALVIAVMAKKPHVSRAQLIMLSSLAVLVSIVKQGYWLIALLPLVIPAEYFISKRLSKTWKIFTVGTVLVLSSAFIFLSEALISGAVLTPREGVYINGSSQLRYILNNPLLYASHILLQPFTKSFDTIFIGFVGIVTNRLIYLSVLVIVLLYIGLTLAYTQAEVLPELHIYRRRLILSSLFIVVGTYLFISTALFLGFTQVGSNVVEGLAGRYFLPFVPLILFIPLTSTVRSKIKAKPVTFVATTLAIVIIGLISTVFSIG